MLSARSKYNPIVERGKYVQQLEQRGYSVDRALELSYDGLLDDDTEEVVREIRYLDWLIRGLY